MVTAGLNAGDSVVTCIQAESNYISPVIPFLGFISGGSSVLPDPLPLRAREEMLVEYADPDGPLFVNPETVNAVNHSGRRWLMRLQRHVSRVHSDERGQVTAYFVGISLLLFAIMAFSFDLGLLHLQRRTVQNSVDPGAFAGAAYMQGCPLSWDDGSPSRVQYAGGCGEDIRRTETLVSEKKLHGGDDSQATSHPGQLPVSLNDCRDRKLRHRCMFGSDRQQSYIFGRALGLIGVDVPAEAEAVCLPPAG